ncbi:hypothetical protein [Butyricicoccus sp. Marseille-Q5471]|uniref:hypothetical protein n=1 Tax=Butyricicoccus sp. Marseille-Q5471 TaxID=3039493 RepID=UPI0024BC67E7|nr:hypothetical protein [Butyricicoccus sp. Marseille-Q5471]
MGQKLAMPNYTDEPIYEWSCEALSGGLNLADLEYKLSDNQSPNVLNMWYRNRTLCKRFGQAWYTAAIGAEVLAAYQKMYKGQFVVHAGTKLFTISRDGQTVTERKDGLTAQGGSFLLFANKLYYRNGAEYVVFDGETCTAVTPTIPNVVINRVPDGSKGDLTDPYNLIGAGFSNTFNGDGEATVYQLTDKGLDAAKVTATVGTEEMTEDAGKFTVDRENGKVTFTTAPAKGQNNVVITAYRTVQDDIDSILKCKYAATYGGQNNSRVVIGGNGTSTFYISEPLDPAYFPANNDFTVSNNSGNIYGFGEQYDILCVFLERSIYGLSYEFADSKGMFSTVCINPNIGCDMPGSVQLIENRLVWCNSYAGVHTLVSTQIENERNVQPVSRNINGNALRPGLLQEQHLEKSISCDFDGRYWLCVNGRAYVWDYSVSTYNYSGDTDADALRLSWWRFDNIVGTAFCEDDGTLYILRENRMARFQNDFRDFESAIHGVYQMPLRNFGLSNYLKTVIECWITVRADTASRIRLKYITDNEPNGEYDSEDIRVPAKMWGGFLWNTFQWEVINFAKSFRRKPNKKKVFLFGILLENMEDNRDLSISGITMTWRSAKKIKS